MSFKRKRADNWQQEIPGARWFKADLHVHTIDDHPGGRAKLPDGLSGTISAPDVIQCYARRFLRAAVANGVQVIGLTPHSPRTAKTPESSAVWAIVDAWNEDEDDDGVPFRKKIFAVFPGFEPNIDDGKNGIHLLFLFDPEIGRDRYLALYDAVMDGREPWQHSALRLTPRDTNAVLAMLDQRQSETGDGQEAWRYIALAPHFQGRHGVLQEIGSKVLERFACDRLCGYELGDDKLSADFDEAKNPGKFLLPFMATNRQAFFHASDAYAIDDIGRRHTWLKLAAPRVEALRQAFIASESRMRIEFERSEDGDLRETGTSPDVTSDSRPWLKQVSVTGPGSFFSDPNAGGARFRLSPDLTCIIGGSMTGKSTLLDGLRVHTGATLPRDESIREQVRTRGNAAFAAGSPQVDLDCPGSDPTAPLGERWPALFFAQNELQRLSQDASAVEDVLAKLVPSQMTAIEDRRERLDDSDTKLRRMAAQLAKIDDDLAEAEQAYDRSKAARDELDAFEEVGVARLDVAAKDSQRWAAARQGAETVQSDLHKASDGLGAIDLPEILGESATVADADVGDLQRQAEVLRERLRGASGELAAWTRDLARMQDSLDELLEKVRIDIERELAERGLDAAKLREIREIGRRASLLPSYEAKLRGTREDLRTVEHAFTDALEERKALVKQQRQDFDVVLREVERMFGGRIRARRVDDGDGRPLAKFLVALKQRGITRWWNDLADENRPSPQALVESLERLPSATASALAQAGMSATVQATFRETMTRATKRNLAALRCPDRYHLESRLGDGSYRRLDELSGGQRVSVLLSLLLKTEDDRPLVIDQPEDELDNRFLFETVLPALKQLKGRRQIIVATHSANIVVNGDADMVIQLEATAKSGRAAQSGAIEEPAIRDAIIRTVDGGEEAFRLRRRKYGF